MPRPTGYAPSGPRPSAQRETPSRRRATPYPPDEPSAQDAAEWDAEDDDYAIPAERVPRSAPRAAPRAVPRQVLAAPRSRRGAASSRGGTIERTAPRALVYEITGVLLLAVGALLLYNARFPAGLIRGVLPQFGVGVLRWLFGIGAIVAPATLCLLGLLLIVRRHRANLRAFCRGAATAFLVLLTALHLQVPHHHEFDGRAVLFAHGGLVGGGFAWLLRSAVGEIGAFIVLVALSLVALLLWTEISIGDIIGRTGSAVGAGAARAGRSAGSAGRRTRETFRTHNGDFAEYDEKPAPPVAPAARPARRALPREIVQGSRGDFASAPSRLRAAGDPAVLRVDDLLADLPRFGVLAGAGGPLPGIDPAIVDSVEAKSPASPIAEPAPGQAQLSAAAPVAAPGLPTPRIEFTDAPPPEPVVPDATPAMPTPAEAELSPTEALEAQALATATGGAVSRIPKRIRPEVVRRRFGDGPLMPPYFDDAVRALDPPVVPDMAGADEDVQAGVLAVQETLASFKIDARVTDVKRGPVITRYEVQPAAGVRVASIANLDRDMARSLSAIAVRIEAPVPGKNVVGIEVPNKKVHLVRLRDVLERHEFLAAPSKLSFVLGKDIAGQPKWADLTKMPHMLIAGATNSGKSVCLNSIIASILVRATPEEVKFSLIDPKRVELTLFKDIRHLYHPVVVEPKDAVRALRGMIAEMDRRYKRFAERGVRNIVSFNSKLEEGEAPLPYIVIVIDELADLMMTAAAEFEKLICRLAQLARATGIHLIVATQRPSVNVITGVIKANIPSRVAFAVASQVDSRTILDSVGAERLIGSGDMLFDPNNGGKAVRIQGAYLSEEEVNRIVEVVKAYYAEDDEEFEYGMDLSAMDEDDEEGEERQPSREDKRDELYEEILEYVVRAQEMSASMIQRKFEIGYPRAARIVDQFERDGVLSAANGSKPRKVIGNGRARAVPDD